MIVNKKEFPAELKSKIINKTNKKIKISFFDGSNITNHIFNMSMLEPYKIVFSYKNKHVVAFVVENEYSDKKQYDYFIGLIDKKYKCSITSLLIFVNSNL